MSTAADDGMVEAGRQIGTLAHVAPVQLDPATEEVGAVFH
jgi:hypothetical protein